MRFVSKYQRYICSVRPQQEMVLASGQTQILVKGIDCRFEHGDVLNHEAEKALEVFRFKGLPTELDEVTPINPRYRLSAYDTRAAQKREGWDDDTREFVEQRLLENPMCGIDYIPVDPIRIPSPWPKYDDLRSPKKIAETVRELGLNPEDVVAYERENKNRDEVIALLQAIDAPEAEVVDDGEPVEELIVA